MLLALLLLPPRPLMLLLDLRVLLLPLLCIMPTLHARLLHTVALLRLRLHMALLGFPKMPFVVVVVVVLLLPTLAFTWSSFIASVCCCT
jgi:hypothetical protein